MAASLPHRFPDPLPINLLRMRQVEQGQKTCGVVREVEMHERVNRQAHHDQDGQATSVLPHVEGS